MTYQPCQVVWYPLWFSDTAHKWFLFATCLCRMWFDTFVTLHTGGSSCLHVYVTCVVLYVCIEGKDVDTLRSSEYSCLHAYVICAAPYAFIEWKDSDTCYTSGRSEVWWMSSQVCILETEEYALPTFVHWDWRLIYMFKHIFDMTQIQPMIVLI